jgi:hypothetical protein
MAGVVSRRRCVVGRDVCIVSEASDEVWIEGAVRLRPGMVVELVGEGSRTAVVLTWLVARLGKDGTVYRGRCRWGESGG